MSLTPVTPLLQAARSENKAVGAFNVGNMEMLMGVIKAAETANTPVIIQVAEKRLNHSPLSLVGPMMVGAAGKAGVDIGVQLDHGFDAGIIHAAIDYGFTAVMFDGSALSLTENIIRTKEIVDFSRRQSVEVEAEIGTLGGSEGGPVHQIRYSDPEEARRLVEQTGCSSLAVAIGNAHGHYRGNPHLNFEVLEKIAAQVSVPLVLHGGSGLSEQDFRKAICLGIRKINIATAGFEALVRNAEDACRRPDNNYFKLSEAMVQGVYENTLKHINIFNNK